MIEDKKDGIKIAEDPVEAYWTEEKKKAQEANMRMTAAIEINHAVIKIAEEKLKTHKK